MKQVLTFDLDNTIFNSTPVSEEAFRRCHKQFYYATFFNVYDSYPKDVADELTKLFKDNMWFNTPLLNKEIPFVLNILDKSYNIYYVSNRLRQAENSFDQLIRNGINCSLSQIINTKSNKIPVLKELNSSLHFDDAPHVIESCLTEKISCHMISNYETKYNHYLRDKVVHSKDLLEAIKKEKLLEKIR